MNKSATNEPFNEEIAAQIEKALSADKLKFRSFQLIVIAAVLFGAMGAFVGWLLTMITPAYYTDVFDTMESDLWQIGLAMGLSRGLICGVIAGSSVLLSTSWYRSRVKTTILQSLPQAKNSSANQK